MDIDDSYVALSNLINWIHFGYAKSGFNGKRFSIGLFYSSIHSASRKLSLNLSHVAKISLSFRVHAHTRAQKKELVCPLTRIISPCVIYDSALKRYIGLLQLLVHGRLFTDRESLSCHRQKRDLSMRLPSGPVLVEPRQNLDPSSNNACTRDLSRLRVSQNYYGDIYIYTCVCACKSLIIWLNKLKGLIR